MNAKSSHYQGVAAHHDKLAEHGVFGLLAPQNRGGGKSEYVTSVFDQALLPLIRERPHSSMLDFGCGTGVFCRKAAPFVEQVVGVDISGGALEVAKQVCAGLGNVTLCLTDGDHLPFPEASFDCAVEREALMYVPDAKLDAVLTEIYRVLRPGGRFLLLDQVSDDPYWQRYPGTPLQLKRSPSGFRDAAARAGFTLVGDGPVRTPRFPAIYLAWSGLVPRPLIPRLARLEVAWHRGRRHPGKRWWNALFLLTKPA
ncbi:class I SAM-dependent methyltransferase [Dyella humi]|uniref:Methyltransferase domain-containing protein n=1 Tax=Dyella humi TaxID=1770547 RepID=A0ABW8IFI4_9GAMM